MLVWNQCTSHLHTWLGAFSKVTPTFTATQMGIFLDGMQMDSRIISKPKVYGRATRVQGAALVHQSSLL